MNHIRQPFSICLALALAFGILASAGASAFAQEDQDATALLDASAATMLELNTFHFVVSTPEGTTTFLDAVELVDIQGDVVRPNSFRAEFRIALAFVKLSLEAIGIGSNIWVSDPLSGDGSFIKVSDGSSENLPPTILLNPDELIAAALELVQEPVVAGTESIDGTETTRVNGTFDPAQLIDFGTPVADELLTNVGPLDISFWIDDQDRIIRLEIAGPFLPGETADAAIVRRIDLSKFNEIVVVEAPATGG